MSDAPIVVVAPNWLGDAVMALPAIVAVGRHFVPAPLLVAARRSVVDLFRMVPGVDGVLTFEWNGAWWRRRALNEDADRLRVTGARGVILFPNSFASALVCSRAGVADIRGYASDMRTRLLSRAVPRPKAPMHQGEYYQHLVRALGIDTGPLEPAVSVPETAVAEARALLVDRGWDAASPLIVLAPGAAYGKAKQWIPAHVVRLVTDLVRTRRVTCVLVGGRGDASTTAAIRKAVPDDCRPRVIDLAGATTLALLGAVISLSRACVANDSGAMHLAAAVGVPVVSIFGPTNERATHPLTRARVPAEVLTHPVWCRPCMLRECPIDHRCMTGIEPSHVLAALDRI